MKGCLKQSSRAPSPTAESHNHCQHTPVKHVAFGADGDTEQVQVFFADEYDRTPAEPARNLSYQDILELKEIQRSLPRAIQPADIIGSKPASHYLSTVPIGLLPLLPESDLPASPVPPSAAPSPAFAQNSWRTFTPASTSPHHQQQQQQHPSHLSHLPQTRTPLHRPKPRFAFLPLLEPSIDPPLSSRSSTPSPPPSSERSLSPDFDFEESHDQQSSDPPTPALTNASVDSSPRSSRASSCSASPEPTFLQLPPSCGHGRFCGVKSQPQPQPHYNNPVGGKSSTSLIMSMVDDQLAGTEPWIRDSHHDFDYRRPGFGASKTPLVRPMDIPAPTPSSTPTPPTKKKGRKEKKVIVINDIEIELDEDDDDSEPEEEEEENNTPPAKTSSIPRTNARSPTPTRSSSTSSPTFNLHTPISFKRPSSSTGSNACSPPRGSVNSENNRGVLVPSA